MMRDLLPKVGVALAIAVSSTVPLAGPVGAQPEWSGSWEPLMSVEMPAGIREISGVVTSNGRSVLQWYRTVPDEDCATVSASVRRPGAEGWVATAAVPGIALHPHITLLRAHNRVAMVGLTCAHDVFLSRLHGTEWSQPTVIAPRAR